MYEKEIIENLREFSAKYLYEDQKLSETCFRAADAIEELQKKYDGAVSDNKSLSRQIAELAKERNEAYSKGFLEGGIAQRAEDEKWLPKWIPIESKPMDEDERQYYSEHFGYALSDDEAVIYCCELPDDGEEVLTCNRYGDVRIDTFNNDPEYGCYFEDNEDMDGIVAWMRKPKPYEPLKET